MAIPSMPHSSSLTEVSMLPNLNETRSSDTERKTRPVIQTGVSEELQTDTEEAEETHISAQPRGNECQTIGTLDSSIQSYIRNSSLSDTSFTSNESEKTAVACSFRKRHRKHRTKTKNVRKPRRTCREDAPVLSKQRNNSFSTFEPRIQSVDRFSSKTERLPQAQQVTQTPDLQNGKQEVTAGISCLRLHRLEVEFPSTIESRSTTSDHMEPNSDLGSAYIYAESIKGVNSSCCTFTGDVDTYNPPAKMDNSYQQDPMLESVWNSLKRAESFCQDSDFKDSENLYISNEDKFSSNMSGCSAVATAGSDHSSCAFGFNAGNFESFINNCDFDSSCLYTDWEKRRNGSVTENSCSLAEAVWGSNSSPSSCSSGSSWYTDDRASETSYCSIDRQTYSSESDSCVLKQPENGFEKIKPDLLNKHEGHEEFVPELEGHIDSHDALTLSAVENICRDVENETKSGSESCFSEVCPKLDLRELEGVVTQTDLCQFSGFFCETIKKETQDKVTEKININDGFLFHPKQFLQAKSSRYREGLEYSVLRHIQNGSYGDVFSIRDKQTGFTCAAKKIPLCSFRWEEIETWSRLNAPHVLQLYGAVREGPNVILFMDLKRGSVGHVLRMRGGISEVLALYYHCQVLEALDHLHCRRVVHLDVKADNVLLSEDGRQCFLCDFGLSETLNQGGYSTKTFRGNVLRGTESHMPPEVARGDPRSAKADVWSSCCMLLHMLNGHQPWTRNFPHPLYLKIVSEPPPLWEIPPDCDPLTCDVIKAGLVKDPRDRLSASELLQKTVEALRTVCGLSGPGHETTAFEDWTNVSLYDVSVPSSMTPQKPPEYNIKAVTPTFPESLSAPTIHWVSTWREKAANEDDSDCMERDSVEESDWEEEREMNELKTSKTSSWMKRYWGEENNNRSVERNHSDVERETSKTRTDMYDEETENKISGETGEERKTEDHAKDLTERRVVFEDHSRYLSEELESCDDQIRSFVDDGETDEEVESDLESLRELGNDWSQEELEPFLQLQKLYGAADPHLQSEDTYSDSDEESVILRKSEQKETTLLECYKPQAFSCTSPCDSEPGLTEEDSDDLSSGVFSSCSTADSHSFNVDWSVSTNQTASCYFEGLGVDIWVEDVNGESLKIRERPQVKIGHVAVGISEQISMKVFSLATLDGRPVSPDTEVCESGMWLQCVPAPDGSSRWNWRVRDGKLELQEYEEHSDSCSTLPL